MVLPSAKSLVQVNFKSQIFDLNLLGRIPTPSLTYTMHGSHFYLTVAVSCVCTILEVETAETMLSREAMAENIHQLQEQLKVRA